MDILTQVADKLAQEVLEVERETGDEDLVEAVKKAIGASSTTLEEAYMTAVRVRRAEARARTLLDDVRRAKRENG